MTSHPRRAAGPRFPPAEVRILPLTRGSTRGCGPTVSPHDLLADLAAAVDVVPDGGEPSPREVLVTAVGFPDRIEIEFADSGPGLTHRERHSLPPRGTPATALHEPTDPLLDDLRHLVVALGGSISAMDCPEGGSAVTLCLPTRPAALRRAA